MDPHVLPSRHETPPRGAVTRGLCIVCQLMLLDQPQVACVEETHGLPLGGRHEALVIGNVDGCHGGGGRDSVDKLQGSRVVYAAGGIKKRVMRAGRELRTRGPSRSLDKATLPRHSPAKPVAVHPTRMGVMPHFMPELSSSAHIITLSS
jgi:hypothetical protein